MDNPSITPSSSNGEATGRTVEIEMSDPQMEIIESTQQVNLFLAGQGSGKCLAKGTIVRMLDGRKKAVQDIEPGDLLMGPDSRPRKVISIATGMEQMYWIRQNRAMDYRVNESHILSLRQSRSPNRDKIVNISVKDYLGKCQKFKESYMGYRAAVYYSKKALPIDPYFLGIWLGDGAKEKIAICAMEPEIINYVEEFASQREMIINHRRRSANSFTHIITNGQTGGKPNPLLNLFRSENLLNNKHIPFDYLTCAREDRLQLLAGLIDTDGHYDSKKNAIEITQKNKQLAAQIWELGLSLGFRVSIKGKNATLKRPGREDYRCPVYRVSMYGDMSCIPCRVKRKQPRCPTNRMNYQNTGIRVEKDTVDQYYGFTLDGDGLFLLEDFTVTHNTHCGGVLSGILISQFPRAHGFIGANTYTQLSDSTLFRIRMVWKEKFGWTEYHKGNKKGNFVVDVQPPAHFNTEGHEYDSYHGKICFQSGTVVYKGSLDNYKAHDGKEFAWAILDETKDTKEEAVKEVIIGRLREPGMWVTADGQLTGDKAGEPFNPLYIFTSPAKVEWINKWFDLDKYQSEITRLIYSDTTYFCRKIDNKLAVISSSYHNQANLPSNFIENQKSNLHTALQDMLIYGNPFSQSGGEFYKCFDRTRHVRDLRNLEGFGEVAYRSELPLHATFDFNVSPYMTCCVWQITGKKAYQIDEICLPNPRNTTPDVCREFIRRYQGHKAGLFIYGDPAGKHEDTRQEKGQNDFTLILSALAQFKPGLRVQTAAPPVVMRGNFINTIFEKGFEAIEILVHDKCPESIKDYNYLKEASDGTKLKEKTKNPDTGITFEKYGHCSDANDYFICTAFAYEFAKYQVGGSTGKTTYGKNPKGKNDY